MVLLRDRVARRGVGAIEPYLPSPAKRPPENPSLWPIERGASRAAAPTEGSPQQFHLAVYKFRDEKADKRQRQQPSK